jgi:predicted DNA-binding protein (UPF0251 family)
MNRAHIDPERIIFCPGFAMAVTIDALAFELRDADSAHLSARRTADALGISLTELASLIGISRNTLTAASGARKVDAALSPLVRILAMAAEMAGGTSRAAIWFKHQPIPGWAGKTAFDLVREGQADKVLTYLEAVRSGVYA